MIRSRQPKVTKIETDDFKPRFEYPESMKRLEEYCKKVKESGLHYGDYVAANPDAMQPKKEEEKRKGV